VRLRQLVTAGLVDSFGLSLGWTLFNLLAVERGGLEAAALFNAAMLIGIVLSAPVTTGLARRLSGRRLLTGAASIEAVLRILTLGGLLAGWAAPIVAAGVVGMYVCAFAGFAAMRAEVAAIDARPRASAGRSAPSCTSAGSGSAGAMTRYAMSILAVEAIGAGLVALLPIQTSIIIIVYGASLLPTIVCARKARVTSSAASRSRLPVPLGVLAGGATIGLLAYGPTLLNVALATELHGQNAVAYAAVSFSAGCLLSSMAVEAVARLRLPATLAWPMWGIVMLFGWIAAPWHVAGLCLAQFMSGVGLTAFEGGMDARVAGESGEGTVTTALAWTAAIRATGSAVAVRVLPLLVTAPAIGAVASAGSSLLAIGAVTATILVGALAPGGRHRLAKAASVRVMTH
jgi:hypothetical protein